VERWGGSHRRATSQSFERLFSETPLLWPVERVGNKAVSEKAGWLAPGTLLYMWRALQFTGKMTRDKKQKHRLAVRAESRDEPVCLVLLTGSTALMLTAIYVTIGFVIKWEENV